MSRTFDSTRSLADYEQQFVNPNFAPRPQGDIPSAGIQDAPTYTVQINAEWLPHVLGALAVLRQIDAWLGTENEIEDARSQVSALIAAISED